MSQCFPSAARIAYSKSAGQYSQQQEQEGENHAVTGLFAGDLLFAGDWLLANRLPQRSGHTIYCAQRPKRLPRPLGKVVAGILLFLGLSAMVPSD